MAATTSPMASAVGEKHQNIADVTHIDPKQSYASQLHQKQSAATISQLQLRPVTVLHGEPVIEFTLDEINDFTREEGLHQAVVIKFSYGKPEIQEIRRVFSMQFDVQGRCNIGQLDYRHILLRFDLYTDFVQFLSRPTGYIKVKGDEYFFRTFPWTFGFNPKEETTMAVVWISFPGLPPNLFAKKSLLSIASAAGKVLAIDKATQDRTRSSAARVKVLLDLLDKHPTKVKLSVVDKSTGKSIAFYQDIVYDNMPNYCNHCKHQGHAEGSCRFLKQKSGQNDTLAIDRKKTATTVKSVDQLQGDARVFLNAKRASQAMEDRPLQEVNNGKLEVHIGGDKNVTDGLDSFGVNATGKSLIVEDGCPVVECDDAKRIPKTVIPSSTIFARVNEAIDNGQKSFIDMEKTDAERQCAAGISSKVVDLVSESQSLGSKTNGKKAVHGVYKDDGKIDDVKREEKSKKGEVWNVVTYKKSPTNKVASSGHSSPGVRRNSACNASSSNTFDVLALDKVGQLDLAIPNDTLMSKQLVPSDNTGQQGQGSEMVARTFDSRRNAVENKIVEDHSSNVPTMHFSSPHVEKIINDAQIAMMRHTNMVRQPLVTLNTSVFEIPSQSEHSFGEHEGESGQMLLSTGNNDEVFPSLREVVCASQDKYEENFGEYDGDNGQSDWRIKCRTWADQVEHQDEEDCGDDEERESKDSSLLGSDDDAASPQLPSTQMSNLNLNAPAFVPIKYMSSITTSSGQANRTQQQQPQIPGQQQHLTASSGQHNRSSSPVANQRKTSPNDAVTVDRIGSEQQQIIPDTVARGSTGQQCATSTLISLEDRRLLDALVSSNPLHSLSITQSCSVEDTSMQLVKKKIPAMIITTKEKDSVMVSQHCEQTLPQQVNVGRDIYEEGEEDDILQRCRIDAFKKGDLSPTHSGQFKMAHPKKSWDGNVSEEVNVRRLPMRVAKQKRNVSTTSTKSNRLKKKT